MLTITAPISLTREKQQNNKARIPFLPLIYLTQTGVGFLLGAQGKPSG